MRHLDWEGCFNVRDLGGLRTAFSSGGRLTRRRCVVRSDAIGRLTAAGRSALHDYGVRTVVDLRNDGEGPDDVASRPAGLATAESFDAETYLRGGGLTEDDLMAARGRLLDGVASPA